LIKLLSNTPGVQDSKGDFLQVGCDQKKKRAEPQRFYVDFPETREADTHQAEIQPSHGEQYCQDFSEL